MALATKNIGSKSAEAPQVSYATPEERATLDRGDFMNLFLAQLQYQDPMNPMQSAEMASQVAQFNMVDLMYKNNEAMQQLVTSDEARTRLQAVTFLGQEVRYSGSTLPVGSNGPKPFDLELEDPVASCVVTIRNSEGLVVRSLDLGGMPSGIHPLNWDGTDAEGDPVPEGHYRVYAEAMDDNGDEVSIGTWTTGAVSGVSYPDTGLPELRLNGGKTQIALDEIWMVGA